MKLPKYIPLEKLRLCGIYFLLRKNQVVYIGATIHFFGRVCSASHEIIAFKEIDSVRFIPCDREVLKKYEKRWIQKFRPKHNVIHLYRMIGSIKYGTRKRVFVKELEQS